MKSYLLINFNSEGATPSEIINRLVTLGFKPITGNYDFEYSWKREPSTDEAIELADKVHEILKGYNVIYKMETI
ncbi:MAG: hypothetical protein ACP5RS_01025 [Thermoplasmata archaeon]|jgi:hypothetical protein